MYTEKTLRKRAKEIGLRIEKGYEKTNEEKPVVQVDVNGKKVVGYTLYDSEGNYVADSANDEYLNCWKLSDVEMYLKDEYKAQGLNW